MRTRSAFINEGTWFKGNTHAHTTLSDGKASPEEVTARYRRLNYDFTALTDHCVYGIHDHLQRPDFLVIPGVELHVVPDREEALCHHIVGLGLPGENKFSDNQYIDVSQYTSAAELIQLLQENGNLCIYAHPAWSHLSFGHVDALQGCIGMEVYNYTADVNFLSGLSESYYDQLLYSGTDSWCFACDDSHQKLVADQSPLNDFGGGFIMVKAKELTHRAVMESIISGSFYASQGPEVYSFEITGDQATVVCSPCRSVGFLSDATHGHVITDESAQVTSASYTLKGTERYLRAVCADASGRRAWTQPILTK